MRPAARFVLVIVLMAFGFLLVQPDTAAAQRRRRPAPAPQGRAVPAPPRPITRGGFVFVGGYFYDPFYGPYPWWPRYAYPYQYYPRYDNRAVLRVLVTPTNAAVYVDGFYAGIVDDFNGFFQGLTLPPGGHHVELFLEGYRTVRENVYLGPGSTFKLHDTMVRLPAGERSQPPTVAPPLPPPPADTYMIPRTSPPVVSPTPPATGGPYGTLSLRVQPTGAQVLIDGAPWSSSDGERFMVELPAGSHRLEISKPGYESFMTAVRVSEGGMLPLNVSLMPER